MVIVLLGVIFHIGEMYCLGMVPVVLNGVILLQDNVLIPANTIVPWDRIRDLVASHLIALDKHPELCLLELVRLCTELLRRLCAWLLVLMLLWLWLRSTVYVSLG